MRAIVALALLVPAVASAQPARPLTPAQVLAKVEATYRRPKQLTARFEQTVTNVIAGRPKRTRGTLRVAKPDKIRFDYVDAKGKPDRHFIFDGKTLWVIERANLQVLQHTAAGSPLPGVIAFFLGAGDLAKQFTVAFPKRAAHRDRDATILELVPRRPTAQYARIQLAIDPRTWRVTRTTLVDSSGNTNSFAFSTTDTRTPIKPSLFVFNPRSVPHFKIVRTGNRPPPRAPAPRKRRTP